MHVGIENTSVGTDHVITVIYQSVALQMGKAGMMSHTCIGAGHLTPVKPKYNLICHISVSFECQCCNNLSLHVLERHTRLASIFTAGG